MDNNYVEIEIYGYYFVIPASRLNDLAYITNKLVNVSNSQLVGVSQFRPNSSQGYPRLVCNAMSQCQIWVNSQYTYDVDNNYVMHEKFNINTLGTNGLLTLLLFINILIIGVKMLWKR